MGDDRFGAHSPYRVCLPLVNAAPAPAIEYEAESKSLIAAEKALRAAGLQRVAIYHSHPTSAPIPSHKDCERAYDDSVMYLIISLESGQPEMRAWWLFEGGFEPAEWGFADDSGVE